MELATVSESKDVNVELLTKELLDVLNGNFDKSNIMNAVIHGIVTVEKIKDLNGGQKKSVVISTISDILENNGIDKVFNLDLINNILPAAIDGFIYFANSRDFIKKSCCFKLF